MNFNIFWGFQKNEYFLGIKILCILFFWEGGGSSQYWTIFRGHFYAFQGLFKVKVQNGEYFFSY